MSFPLTELSLFRNKVSGGLGGLDRISIIGVEWIGSDNCQLYDLREIAKLPTRDLRFLDVNSAGRLRQEHCIEALCRKYPAIDILVDFI